MFSVWSYVSFRSPSLDGRGLTPYVLMSLAGLSLFTAVGSYRKRGVPAVLQQQREPITCGEQAGFRLLGVSLILVGVIGSSIGCWLTWDAWSRVARWQRVDATLVHKEISTVGARLVFRYEAEGHRFTGVAFRWVAPNAVRAVLADYELGTVHRVSYNPRDPSEVGTILTYNWELFRASVVVVLLGSLLTFGGGRVYGWSRAAERGP